jgi:hypothetical protein
MPPRKSARAAAHSACGSHHADQLGGQIDVEAILRKWTLSSTARAAQARAAATDRSLMRPMRSPCATAQGPHRHRDRARQPAFRSRRRGDALDPPRAVAMTRDPTEQTSAKALVRQDTRFVQPVRKRAPDAFDGGVS